MANYTKGNTIYFCPPSSFEIYTFMGLLLCPVLNTVLCLSGTPYRQVWIVESALLVTPEFLVLAQR
jgi:hypothetical protein